MKISLIIASTLCSMISCVAEQSYVDNPSSGEPINRIGVSIANTGKTRVGVEIDDTNQKDVYFWKEGDVITFCEVNAGGTQFTGSTFSYVLNGEPAHGDMAYFSGSGLSTLGSYVAVHTRRWENVTLPTSPTATFSINSPVLLQSVQLSSSELAAVQSFADNLIFSSAKISGTNIDAGNLVLEHRLAQVDLLIKGDASDNGAQINRVALIPDTPNAYGSSADVSVSGGLTNAPGGGSVTFVTDPAAVLNSSTPYKVRTLVLPSATASAATVKVSCGIRMASGTASSKVLICGEIARREQTVGALAEISGDVMNATPYVGAFWRRLEVGERLIRINTTDAGDIGAWTASVVWTDSKWAADEIMLSTASLPAYPAASVPSGTDTPEVTDGSTSVSGRAKLGAPIYFKIGLSSTYTVGYDPDTSPARYAIIAINYNNYNKVQLLYLRQGEEADIIGGSAVKWSVYNSQPTTYAPLASQGTIIPVAYPTRAGGYRQFNDATGFFSPRDPRTPSSAWVANDLATSIGTACPSGYKLPTGDSNASEMHSLLTSGTTSVWGYYADGFFDRGTIATNVSVGSGNDVAYQGRLFVNTITKASLFIPASGVRSYSDGTLYYVGATGCYWSSSLNGTGYSWYLNFSSGGANRNGNSSRSAALGIRCVRQ